MEQNDLSVDAQFVKGYNDGYLLAKHEPKLATQLSHNANDHSPFFKGLVAGKKQYEKEIGDKTNSISKVQPMKGDREHDLER
jgi:hypothetical protein